jgi:hypothetical protein
MPCFLYQDLIIMFISNKTIQYNQPSFSPTLLFSHLIFIILSRIELILPIQSRGRKINRSYSIIINLLPLYLPAQHIA